MPKMKTKRAAAKRLRTTGSGKVRRGAAGKQHLMRGKAKNRLRALRKNRTAAEADVPNVRTLIPYKF